jgi:predicted ABC-type ATPase
VGYVDRPGADPERGGPGSAPESRLTRLPDAHPSADGYAGRGPEGRRLTDDEHRKHAADVTAAIDTARALGQTTEMDNTIDNDHEVWTEARELQHNDIIEALQAKAAHVPCDGWAVVAGGLAGCGKTTVLREHAGIEPGSFMMINPDEIKEELAKRGMVPEVTGLSPMEAAELAHEESSHIAKRLAQILTGERRNVIWDITMSTGQSADNRVQALRDAGYTHIHGIFVDLPIDVSLKRADARHREGHDALLAGTGLGGRFVRAEMTLAQADSEWGSLNRRNFEQVKPRLDSWARYDNSRDGEKPRLVELSWTQEER